MGKDATRITEDKHTDEMARSRVIRMRVEDIVTEFVEIF